jgi:hypothetical protein
MKYHPFQALQALLVILILLPDAVHPTDETTHASRSQTRGMKEFAGDMYNVNRFHAHLDKIHGLLNLNEDQDLTGGFDGTFGDRI